MTLIDDLLGLGRDPDTAWMRRGLCSQVDPDLFFPESRGGGRDAFAPRSIRTPRSVCARCPVQPQCLTYALERPELEGIWGGTVESQRKLLRSARAPQAA